MTLDQIFQLLIAGVTIGSIYALIALGFVVIFKVTGVINLAQGEFAMLGALLAITFSSETGLFNRTLTVNWELPLPLAIALATLLVMAIGIFLYQFAIQLVHGESVIVQIIITIGIAIALRGGALIVWGTDPYRLPNFTPGPPIQLGNAVLTRQDVWVVGTTLVLLLLLYLFFQHTMLGKGLQACSVNRLAARLMGINVSRMMLLAFALSAGLGAVAGIVIAPKTFVGYEAGAFLTLKGFVAVIIGGTDSEKGAVVAGIALGILETLAAGLLSSSYKDAVAFLVLIVVLLLQTSGILRRGTLQEVAGI